MGSSHSHFCLLSWDTGWLMLTPSDLSASDMYKPNPQPIGENITNRNHLGNPPHTIFNYTLVVLSLITAKKSFYNWVIFNSNLLNETANLSEYNSLESHIAQ